MTLKDIVEQLEKCCFKDEMGHEIENNIAFIELKRLAEVYPVLLGDKLEVEIEGEISGVKTSVKKEGRVVALALGSTEKYTLVNARVTDKLPSPYNVGNQPFGYKTISKST